MTGVHPRPGGGGGQHAIAQRAWLVCGGQPWRWQRATVYTHQHHAADMLTANGMSCCHQHKHKHHPHGESDEAKNDGANNRHTHVGQVGQLRALLFIEGVEVETDVKVLPCCYLRANNVQASVRAADTAMWHAPASTDCLPCGRRPCVSPCPHPVSSVILRV